MVIGTGKDVVTVLVSIAVFGDVFGPENFAGLFLIICGIAAYNLHKARELKSLRPFDSSSSTHVFYHFESTLAEAEFCARGCFDTRGKRDIKQT